MNERRLQLGMEWKDVATKTGVSYETLRNLRLGKRKASELTIRRLEDALQWKHGSIDAILAGGDPTPAEQDILLDEDAFVSASEEELYHRLKALPPLELQAILEIVRAMTREEEPTHQRK